MEEKNVIEETVSAETAETKETAETAEAVQETESKEMKELKEKLEKAEAERVATNDKYLRMAAEYENFRKRSANYTRGLLTDHKMMESVVPYFEMEDGKLTHLELLPVALGIEEPRYRNGNPRFAPDRGILERLAQMSAAYGTKITVKPDGIGLVELP